MIYVGFIATLIMLLCAVAIFKGHTKYVDARWVVTLLAAACVSAISSATMLLGLL